MSYSVNWTTKVITVPLTDLTLISGSNYSLDTGEFWIEMRRLEASPSDGLWAEQAIEYVNTQTLSGIEYVAIVKVINGYTWDTDTTNKTISLLGGNSNLLDVFIPGNGISVLANNSAGKQIISTGSGLDAAQSAQLEEIHGGVTRKIWLDTTLGADGSGYQGDPHNNFTSAIDNAEANGITTIVLLADAIADRQLRNFTFEGVGDEAVLSFNSQDFKGSKILGLRLDGTMVSTGPVHIADCHLLDNVAGVFGHIECCGLEGDIVLKTASETALVDCYSSISGLIRPSIDVNGGICDVSVRGFKGGLTMKGSTHASGTVSVGMAQGRLELDASNTAGIISCRGVADFADSSAGSTVDTTGLLAPSKVDELHKLLGLETGVKITITPANISSDDAVIDIDLTGDGISSTTMDRQ